MIFLIYDHCLRECMVSFDKSFLGELKILLRELSPDSLRWLEERCEKAVAPGEIYLAFSMVPRFVPREPVMPDTRNGFFIYLKELGHSVDHWTGDQIGRLMLLLSASRLEPEAYAKVISQLLDTGDIYEQVTIYKCLMFLPSRALLVNRVVDGVRTNINDVFEAIALGNAYPSIYFDELAWNQMVLKALFTSKPIRKIIGIDDRKNPRLAKMALGLAHERWAAGRMVNPDLWRLVGPYLDESHTEDLKCLLSGSEMERKAAALLCRESSNPLIAGMLPVDEVVDYTWEDIR